MFADGSLGVRPPPFRPLSNGLCESWAGGWATPNRPGGGGGILVTRGEWGRCPPPASAAPAPFARGGRGMCVGVLSEMHCTTHRGVVQDVGARRVGSVRRVVQCRTRCRTATTPYDTVRHSTTRYDMVRHTQTYTYADIHTHVNGKKYILVRTGQNGSKCCSILVKTGQKG